MGGTGTLLAGGAPRTLDPAPIRCLDPEGKPLGEPPPLAREHDALRAAYRAMEPSGATITLSNFGSLGGEFATMVVVPPQVAIVGAGQ